jgi:tetratricopeptide (TPR) repeat protein
VRWEKGPKRSRVRVSPELIDACTGVTRWARPLDAAFTDVFAVQADIASQVAGALHLALTDSARARLGAVPTRNLEAYARYLRGLELRSGENSPEALRGAIADLREAVRLDPAFVAGWVELARAQMDAFRQGGLLVGDADSARIWLERAQSLAPDSPEVRAASAHYHLMVEGDFGAALRDYREALRGAPHRSDLLTAAGRAEMELDRWPQAIADLEHAVRLDPRSPDAASWLAVAYARLRRYADARRELDRARSLRPASISLTYSRARLAAAEGDLPTARRVLQEARAAADEAGSLLPLGAGLQSPYVAYIRARIDAMAGDRPAAVKRLRSLLEHQGSQSAGWLSIDRTLEPLRADPEFRKLLAP